MSVTLERVTLPAVSGISFVVVERAFDITPELPAKRALSAVKNSLSETELFVFVAFPKVELLVRLVFVAPELFVKLEKSAEVLFIFKLAMFEFAEMLCVFKFALLELKDKLNTVCSAKKGSAKAMTPSSIVMTKIEVLVFISTP